MTPTYEEMLQGATTWRGEVEGLAYTISHHGFHKPDPSSQFMIFQDGHPGTWCYYLLVSEQMYPKEWAKFESFGDGNGFYLNGPAFNCVDFHGGITFASSEPYFDRKTGREWNAAKVGCDYNHLWDGEAGYPDTLDSVRFDAERSCRELLNAFPNRNRRCAYTGVWAPVSEGYVARNGAWVVASAIAKKENVSEHWMIAEPPAIEATP